VVAADGRLTYGELRERAARVARWLQRRGVGPDVLVGISLERSTNLIVGLLGILEAAGAYVALDASYPRPRLEMMLEDARIRVVIADGESAGLFRGLGREVLTLDEGPASSRVHGDGEAGITADETSGGPYRDPEPGPAGRDAVPRGLPAAAPARPTSAATAEDLAYVAYTSGSTGRPKGVCVTHRAVVRLVTGGLVTLGPDEVVLHFSPVSFDASTFEIWGCLANGGRLVVAPPGPLSLEELGRTLREAEVTTAWFTAGLFHQMVDEQLHTLAGLRQVLAGGDVLSAAHVQRLLAAPGRRRVINGYGPTENTTFTCCHVMEQPDEVEHPVPIGRPIANTRIYVLDGHGNPVPAGVPGELYAGGDGVARGYLGAPDATAERFVPDPFGGGGRLYRTGDRVRFRPDGVVEFLGRSDRQVKVRGFRVEPGEVEAVLVRHPAVERAVVAPPASRGDEQMLTAYVVPRSIDTLSLDELRRFVAEHLPAYLVPSAFISVEHIPLTDNGKVDVDRLVRLEAPGNAASEPLTAPATEVEEALVAMWSQVLRRDAIGVHEDFFADLGGHSLLATQVISRVREAFGVEIPLRRLFEAPTVAQLAAAVEEAILDELEAEGDEVHDVAAVKGWTASDPLPMEPCHGD
jgi:amino acid adenylation domain-containing protein